MPALQFATVCSAAEFHVAPAGDDGSPGTAAQPFATLERARDAARSAKGATVVLAEGIYRLKTTLALDGRDSGIRFRGEKAVIRGSIPVPPSCIQPATDPALLARMPPDVRGKVMQIDLKALGIADTGGGIGPRGFGRPYTAAPVELFLDDEPLALSRWPKAGQPGEPIGKVLDDGLQNVKPGEKPHGATFHYSSDRISRWKDARDIWITGFFNNGYADDTLKVKSLDTVNKTLTTEQRHGYGFSSENPWNRWTALNLLEELSLPGEYMIDSQAGALFFLPPAGKAQGGQFELSVLAGPLVSIIGATGVVFDGVDFECARGTGIYIEGGTGIRIQNATLRNLGMLAVCIGRGIGPDRKPFNGAMPATWSLTDDPVLNRNAGTNHGIENCRISNIGAGAISLGGGDRRTLAAAGNFVRNCEITRFNRWDRTYRGAVNIDGVGNRIEHCLIHDAPGVAILLHGNDHVIEFNEIHHVMMEGDDMGAFYMGRDPTERGNILRFNHWHDIAPAHKTFCLYFDDSGGDSTLIHGNIFRKAGHVTTVRINGGSDMNISNNIFIDCTEAIRSTGSWQWRTKDKRFENRMKAVGHDRPPWSTRYPDFVRYLEERKTMTRNIRFARNLLVNIETVGGKGFIDEHNLSTKDKPDWNAPGIPGFEAIPFDRIGLLKSP